MRMVLLIGYSFDYGTRHVLETEDEDVEQSLTYLVRIV